MTIHGAKKGSSKQRQPVIAPDSAQSKTYIKILYGLGEGEIAGLADGYKSVYLDDTPLQNDDGEFNFAGVKVDFRAGTNDQTYIDGFPDVASETNVGVELKHGTPFVKAFNNLDLDALRVRIKWGALRQQNPDNGDVGGVKIDYAIDVKTDNGGWVQALNTSINAKTSNAYERSHRIDLPKAGTGWAVRVRRITPNSTSELVSDKMFVSAITEVIDLKLRYPNTALLGLRYDAMNFSNVAKMAARCRGLIIKVPTNYNPITRTYDGLWDGQFKLAYTNNPAWVYYDLCTAERYGLGSRLTQSMIDKWSLYRLAQYCDQMVDDGMGGQEPRFTVNVYIQSADGAFELLSRLAGVFRAISYWDGTSIVLDADIPQDSIYSFSRANVIDGVFEYTGTRARDRHTVAKVAWDNPANHFKTEYEYVRDEKAIAKFGVRVADIQAWGCTSKGQAQRAGLWALKSEQLETRMVTFKVGLDGYIPAPAKVIEISDELFAGRATGGRVLAINKTKTVITLDRAITAKAGDTLVINGDDGTSQRRQISGVNGDNVTVTKPFGDISEQNVWVLDSQDLATMKFRVLSVTADDNHQFTITAVQYNPVKYDAIDTGAYTPERPISVINPTVQAPTKSVNLSSYHTVNQGVSITTLVIGWEQVTGAVKYAVQWRKDNGNWQTLPPTGTNSIEITGVYAGQYEARVTAISAFGQASLATHSNLTQIQGKQGKPPRPINLSVQGILFGMNLGWNFAKGSGDTNFTEIEVSPDGRTHITTLGTFAYPTNKHEITGLQGNFTQFYRARIVDKLGNTSDWTDWAFGTTSADAEKVLDILSGQISQSHLDQSLRTPIAKIGTIESKISGINSKIPAIESNINSFKSKIPSINKIPTIESAVNSVNGNLSTLNSQLATAQNELATAKSTLQTAVGNITTERNRITAAIRDITALQADKNAKTQEIANLTQTVGSHTSSIRELGVTTGDLSQKYSQLKTTSDTANSEISAIKQTQNGQAMSVERLNARFEHANLFKASNATNGHFLDEKNRGQLTAWDSHRTSDFISVKTNTVYEIKAYNGDFSNLRVIWLDENKTFIKGKIIARNGDYATFNSENASFVRISSYWRRTEKDVWVMQVAGLASDAMAEIETLNQTITDANGALSERIDSLQSDYNGNKASVAGQLKTLSDKDTTTAQKLSKISANIATIENTANDALSRAKTATSTISTEQKARVDADNSLASRISTLDSAYKTADNQLSTRISTAEQTATDAKTALATAQSQLNARFDNLAVGGRNLLRNTQNPTATSPIYHATTTAPHLNGVTVAYENDVMTVQATKASNRLALSVWNDRRLDLEPNADYVLSGLVKVQSDTELSVRWFKYLNRWISHIVKFNATTEWAKFTVKFSVPNEPITGAFLDLIINVPMDNAVSFKSLKLEKGSIPTDWTPAPEDTQSQLDEKATTANLQNLRQTLTNADNALSQQITAMDTAYKSADRTLTANLASETTVRTNADNALTQRINSLTADYNGNKASVANQLKTLSDKDTATASQISQLTANVTTAQNTANTANGKADTATTKTDNAQNTANNALTRANTANSAITAEQRARADADTALGQRITAIDTAYKQADTATNAKLANAEKAISDNNTALSQRINTLDAQYKKADKDLTARLAREQTARANGDTANSQAIRTLESTVQGVSGRVGTSESKIATLERTTSDTNQALATAQSRLNARFDSLSVGGRNLLFNTANFSKYSSYNNRARYANMDSFGRIDTISSGHVGILVNTKSTHTIKANEQAILSFEYRTDMPNLLYTYIINDNNNWRIVPIHTVVNDGQWQKAIMGFTAPRDLTNVRALMGAMSAPVGSYLEIGNVKLERGNMATDWTEAPEDLQVDLSPYATSANLDEFKQTQADKDRATAQKLSKLQSDIGTKANATALNSLTTKVNQADGKITAQTQRLSTLQSSVSGNTSSINTLSQSLTTKERALSEQINTAKSELGGRITQISNETRTLSNANRTVGEQINTVQTTVQGQTASIRNVERSVNGVRAIKAVTVDNNGFISGYGLMSDLQNGRVTSRFGINADQIYFGTTTNAKKPFVFTTRTTTIDGVSYPAGAWLNSASIAHASINMLHIADSIQSDNYVAGRQGWRLFKDGRFELNNTFGDGSSLELNSQGLTVWYDKAQGKKAVELGILL